MIRSCSSWKPSQICVPAHVKKLISQKISVILNTYCLSRFWVGRYNKTLNNQLQFFASLQNSTFSSTLPTWGFPGDKPTTSLGSVLLKVSISKDGRYCKFKYWHNYKRWKSSAVSFKPQWSISELANILAKYTSWLRQQLTASQI